MENPLKALKESAGNLKADMEAIAITTKNQTELIRRQVEDVAKQTKLLERWALAAEAQVEILQNIFEAIKEKGANK